MRLSRKFVEQATGGNVVEPLQGTVQGVRIALGLGQVHRGGQAVERGARAKTAALQQRAQVRSLLGGTRRGVGRGLPIGRVRSRRNGDERSGRDDRLHEFGFERGDRGFCRGEILVGQTLLHAGCAGLKLRENIWRLIF